MRRLPARRLLGCVVLSGLLWPTPGCRRLAERQAIRKYAAGAARANGKLRKLRALEANILVVRKTGRASEVRRFFKERYLPAFKAYLDAVRTVPTGTPRLSEIHGRYVQALERASEAYASYTDHVTTATLITAWTPVQQERARLTGAEDRYRADISAYYRSHDVKLAGE
ncbi:MAG: hypothetical protein ABI333_20950 [bacterium]